MLMMAVYDMALPVSAVIAVIIDFPDDILWILLVQWRIRINTSVNENPMLIDVHQWQLLNPLQMLFEYDGHIGFVAFILSVRDQRRSATIVEPPIAVRHFSAAGLPHDVLVVAFEADQPPALVAN